MAYSKNTWADRIDSGNKYSITDNGDGTSKIEYAGTVTQEGTPVNAENLNHMEQGIYDAHENKVDKETGKGLSANDYTTAEKNKLAGLSNYDDTAVNNAMVRADAPDEDGFSQLYKTVNGQRVDIDPKTSGGSGAPYIYMTADEYEQITPVTDQLYWVTGGSGKHGVYLNGSCVEGTNLLVHIYGVSWDGSSSTSMTRTGDAANFSDPVPAVNGGSGSSPFDSCYPWSEIERVTIGGNELVKIPKFWYKITQTGNAMTFEIADGAKDGFLVSPAHADRGDGKGERDYVYIARYKCSSSNWKSVSGASPKVNVTRSEMRTGITSLGTGYYMQDFAMFWTTRLLYIVEYADWNSQAKIGYGCGNNSSVQGTGASDSMSYHTGTMQSSRTTYGVGVQYRYIEDPWGNVLEWCDGIRFSSTTVYAYKKPSEYSDSTGGTSVGTRPSSSNYISKWNVPSAAGYEWALYPSEVSGSGSTLVADCCDYSSSGVVLYVGGGYGQYRDFGLFCLGGNCDASSKGGSIGGRLQYLP